MSEFQTGLLLIGALAVIGVFGYNKWQERRARRGADETFKSRHPDILMDPAEAAPRARPAMGEGRIEPGFASRPPEVAARPPADKSDGGLPDPRVDYIVDLAADHPIAVATLQELWAGAGHRFAGRASFAAWIDGRWSALPQSGRCEKLRAALQLVSRAGVVGEGELLEFRSAVETLAATMGVSVAAPEMREALESARELDGACAEADIQIAFHLVAAAGASFPGTKLRAAAEASGFTLDAQGRFELRDDSGRELYALADRGGGRFSPSTMKDAAPQALTLSMDVPRAPDTQRTFEAMVSFGSHLASLMSGTLVDDNDRPLDDRSVSAIEAQLNIVRRGLEARGVPPGSVLALRVFS